MRVFISHKSEDEVLAEKYAKDLRKLGFDIYFDEYDPIISSSADRPSHIKNNIKNSSDLLVIITNHTKESWWVPFEIGLATFNDCRIASIIHENSPKLPSFIRKWPIIETKDNYYFYLKELEKNRQELIEESKTFSKSIMDGLNIQQMRTSDLFHKVLMNKFNQL